MAITQKPKSKKNPTADEAAISNFIGEGSAKSKSKLTGSTEDIKNVQLRLTVGEIQRIDAIIPPRPKKSRHDWLLETIISRLEQEERER